MSKNENPTNEAALPSITGGAMETLEVAQSQMPLVRKAMGRLGPNHVGEYVQGLIEQKLLGAAYPQHLKTDEVTFQNLLRNELATLQGFEATVDDTMVGRFVDAVIMRRRAGSSACENRRAKPGLRE